MMSSKSLDNALSVLRLFLPLLFAAPLGSRSSRQNEPGSLELRWLDHLNPRFVAHFHSTTKH